MTPTKRFVVRIALVTSTTLATIMGAQALASLDGVAFEQTALPPIQLVNQPPRTIAPEMTNPSNITATAPNLVVLRRAGEKPTQMTTTNAPTTNRVTAPQITPPNAVLVAPSVSTPRTRSSR